jgi:hypothetical protein
MRIRAGLAGAAVLVAALACAAVALASTPNRGTYTGKTSQGLFVDVRVDKHHIVKRFRINWFAKCNSGETWATKADPEGTRDEDLVGDPIDQTDKGTFGDSGSYSGSKDAEGIQGHFTINVAGHFYNKTHAKGSFDVKVRVTKHGNTIDRCHRAVTWAVG